MRRLLLVLLAVILPLKAVGAVVVPITGAPHHHHEQVQATHGHASAEHHSHAVTPERTAPRAHCDAMAQTVEGDAGVVHEHACPHLGMATLIATPVLPPAASSARQVDEAPAKRFTSIVLDILVPPPTRIS